MTHPVTLHRQRDGTYSPRVPWARLAGLIAGWLGFCAAMGIGIGLALACEDKPAVKMWKCETRYVTIDGKRHVVRDCANR